MAGPTILICMLILPHLFISGSMAATFTMINKCDYTVWPGILSNAGIAPISPTGFALQKGETKAITAPSSWGGRFWGRTHCTEDSTGKFSCVTGDCGSGKIECSGSGAAPPATLAEFTLDGYGGLDFFDVSLVDGYNLPMMVVPSGGTGDNCTSTGCVADLNESCPSELRVTSSASGSSVACKSACEALQLPQYCCSGAYGSPTTCKPSSYSEIFKNACPRAYSYAYDDKTSTFTCASAPDYTITFCPIPNTSQKSSQGQNTSSGTGNTEDTPTDSTMVYEGGLNVNGASPSTWTHVLGSHAIAVFVSIIVSSWQWW
ncbi:Pathogenesis-related thaumatin superfamily protein [Tripterygium wilfordii]|uniref:Pathogenesis-related thaumatin superfamily protein n=1 Tax=Tripterygium wilfordii TaxID=458696 RepID=A0A7J7D3G4_TRIWF|nr:thaumatin-like protein 1b [Tripterygium wilfordii]KAF5740872.1 Pathogenesis-related thaumatin superfamily protein [Tripterygium wilfordii]